MKMQFDLIVIGGGAAGFFGAIQTAEMKPNANILILEKSNKILSKVRISGGGRCNVTHQCFNPNVLAHHYPRGEKSLKKAFKYFHAEHTVNWFNSKGIVLKAEGDGRMFPISDSSETIIECFVNLATAHKIKIELVKTVCKIQSLVEGLEIFCNGGVSFKTKCILITSGGNPNKQFYDFISQLGHTIKPPIPSLFTFNDGEKKFSDLMGVSVADASIKITGTKFFEQGPILITHWGLSGPCVIKLSAWAAEYLHQVRYEFSVIVNWLGDMKEDDVRAQLMQLRATRAKQKVVSSTVFSLPLRLVQRFYFLSEINESKTWGELSHRNINKLLECLIRCPFQIKGKTTFKEEFVTCGGVELNEVNMETMESKIAPNVFFAGEVLNIDGETGGFNFQNAWTTAFLAAKTITQRLNK